MIDAKPQEKKLDLKPGVQNSIEVAEGVDKSRFTKINLRPQKENEAYFENH